MDEWGSLSGARVLVRVDFNTPLHKVDGRYEVGDDFRIRAAVPLFEELMGRGAQVVACTHVGRPHGHYEEKYSVAPMRRRLEELCAGVELMENLRFDPGEESNDDEFGRLLVKGFDYYINEAFGVSHRAHASVMAPPQFLPSAAGPNLLMEVTTLLSVFDEPRRPFVAVIGGAKVADKLAITEKLVEKADQVIIGGAMAFTFWRALGHSIGDSLVDDSKVEACKKLLASAKIVLPTDSVGLRSGASFGEEGGSEPTQLFSESIPDGWMGLDIGPQSAERFAEIVEGAGTVLWNGPMGVFEDERFAAGTEQLARAVARSDAMSIIGGGDSSAALAKFGLCDDVSFISTGGGASLELLEFGDLPGLRALRECPWNKATAQ
jgi:phosphoglycerate kinase